MKKTAIVLTFIFISSIIQVYAQGAWQSIHNDPKPTVECGNPRLMKHMDKKFPGYIEMSNDFMRRMNQQISKQQIQKSSQDVSIVPVVFHIVWNNQNDNLPDSVLHNQIQMLNECFRRTNADTINLRPAFANIVGDSRIEFVLADTDPDGYPTDGIVRTQTSKGQFGGVLPYGPDQDEEIEDWFYDNLMYNYSRIMSSSTGGSDPWDTDEYLNIWISDLRTLEPQFDDFCELTVLGLATPPYDHPYWPDSLEQAIGIYNQGIIIHNICIGSNNPNQFPLIYDDYNGLHNTGKVLVHEVGHYLGLRHIWGDGGCYWDDYVNDTPKADASSHHGCPDTNTCVDMINGVDLPNMFENYMDYSAGDCQNSFTNGQIKIMQSILEDYRIDLSDGLEKLPPDNKIRLFPNPTRGDISINFGSVQDNIEVNVHNIEGKLIQQHHFKNSQNIDLRINSKLGIYLIELITTDNSTVFKVIKE